MTLKVDPCVQCTLIPFPNQWRQICDADGTDNIYYWQTLILVSPLSLQAQIGLGQRHLLNRMIGVWIKFCVVINVSKLGGKSGKFIREAPMEWRRTRTWERVSECLCLNSTSTCILKGVTTWMHMLILTPRKICPRRCSPHIRDAETFQNVMSHLRNIGARRGAWRQFQSEDSLVLGKRKGKVHHRTGREGQDGE
jgi:hypothetical protein